MSVRQISVFLENRKGRLRRVTKTIAQAKVDLRAMSVWDTQEFGILRCVVSDAEAAAKALRDEGMVCALTEVLAVEVLNQPGDLEKLLGVMADHDILIEYLYSYAGLHSDTAVIIFHADDMEKAAGLLAEKNVRMLSEQDFASGGGN